MKNPGGFILLLCLPLAFTFLLGMLFGPQNTGQPSISIKMLIEDHDQSFVSQLITGAFGRGELAGMFDVTLVDSANGRPMMDDAKASALIIIPSGFGESVLNRNPVSLTLVKNPGEAFAPKIAEETVQIMTEALDRLLWVAEKPLTELQKIAESGREVTETEIAFVAIQSYHLIRQMDSYLFPPKITFNKILLDDENDNGGFTLSQVFAFILSGVIVMTLFFTLEVLSRDLFIEKEQRTLFRLLVSPAAVHTFILSKFAFIFIAGYAVHFFAWAVGILLFGITLDAGQMINMLIFSMFIIAGLTGVTTLVYGIARTRDQAQSMAPAIVIVFSILGGAMIDLQSLPPFIQKAAVLSPAYWGINGLKAIVMEGSGLDALVINMIVLGIIAAGFTGISVPLYKRKYKI